MKAIVCKRLQVYRGPRASFDRTNTCSSMQNSNYRCQEYRLFLVTIYMLSIVSRVSRALFVWSDQMVWSNTTRGQSIGCERLDIFIQEVLSQYILEPPLTCRLTLVWDQALRMELTLHVHTERRSWNTVPAVITRGIPHVWGTIMEGMLEAGNVTFCFNI